MGLVRPLADALEGLGETLNHLICSREPLPLGRLLAEKPLKELSASRWSAVPHVDHTRNPSHASSDCLERDKQLLDLSGCFDEKLMREPGPVCSRNSIYHRCYRIVDKTACSSLSCCRLVRSDASRISRRTKVWGRTGRCICYWSGRPGQMARYRN